LKGSVKSVPEWVRGNVSSAAQTLAKAPKRWFDKVIAAIKDEKRRPNMREVYLEARRMVDIMEAARVYAERSGRGQKVVMLAEEYRERAILRLGELRPPEAMAKGTRGQLAGRGVIGTASPEAPINVPTNKELGLSDHISAHATRLATMGKQLFEQVLAKWKQAKDGTGLKTCLEPAGRLNLTPHFPWNLY
jgi:hypothetical protein